MVNPSNPFGASGDHDIRIAVLDQTTGFANAVQAGGASGARNGHQESFKYVFRKGTARNDAVGSRCGWADCAVGPEDACPAVVRAGGVGDVLRAARALRIELCHAVVHPFVTL